MGIPGQSFSSENTSQIENVIGTDKIGEIMNDLDSDGRSFTELSVHDTCEVKISVSSSSEEKLVVVQPERDIERNRTRRAIPKCANRDLGLGWKEKIEQIRKLTFFRIPGINTFSV